MFIYEDKRKNELDNQCQLLSNYIGKKIKKFDNENKEPTTVEELTSEIDEKIHRLEDSGNTKSILKLEISYRHYNGDFGEGSIFDEKYSFVKDENLCILNSMKTFCGNEELDINDLSSVSISHSFILNEIEKIELNDIIDKIKKNNDYIYNESHYKKDTFDYNRYNYIDIKIDDEDYEISSRNDENLIDDLRKLLKINKIDKILKNTIKSIISVEDDYDE